VLVVKQSLSSERELNRFGIGQNFVIPDHAAVARQDIRGKVRVDLIRICVLGQVPFGTEIKTPELVPVALLISFAMAFATVLDAGSDFSFLKLAISRCAKSISRHDSLPRSGEPGGRPRDRRLHDRPTLAPSVTRSSSSCSNVSGIPPSIPAMAPSSASFEG